MEMNSKLRNLAIATVIALAITSLSACGGKDKVAETASLNNLPAVTANAGEAPTITAPTGAAPTTLQSQDIIVGSGTEVQASSTLTVHYTLMTWSNGAIVESSWSGGQPATFPLSGVIAGWQQGLPGAKVGGRRLLVIPADLGYGPNGSGPIGPNETLIFVVDIIGVS
jgi:peptidylprolyl isomerase